ncbi:MAG: diguanylate cyclase [Actinobacteria bacterium]|nr:diguanylate cyclase [Actinomycetota bacterium]
MERTFERLLARYPGAAVGARDGNGLSVPMPASLDIGAHPVLAARAGVDLVAPQDRPRAVEAWTRALRQGAGRADVTLLNGHCAAIHYLDLRGSHGALMAVVVSDGDLADLEELAERPATPPKVCTMRRDNHGQILAIDDNGVRMLGWPAGEVVGRSSLDLVHPDDQARAIDNWLSALQSPGLPHRWRGRYARRDGTWTWLEITNTLAAGPGGDGVVHTEMLDVSDEMAALDELRRRERLLRRLTEALPSGVLQIDRDRRILHRNDRLVEIVGHPEATTLDAQLADVVLEDRAVLFRAAGRALDAAQDSDVEVRIHVAGVARPRVCSVAMRALADDGEQVSGAIVCVSDVTEATVLRAELELRATFDPLTACHNRASIMSLLGATLSRRRSGEHGVAVVFVDLDRFKAVNDAHGHAAGDHVLSVVADRLRGAIREGDAVGRIGGDEFLVVYPAIPSPSVALDAAGRLAQRLGGSVPVEGGAVQLQASLGVSWSADPAMDADSLVAIADAAMYDSKRDGTGRPVLLTAPVERLATRPD